MHVDDIRAEPLSRNLERQQRARAVLEKGVDDGKAAQPVVAFSGARTVERDPLFGLGKDEFNFPGLQSGDAQQMPVRESGGTCWKAAR